MDKKTMNKELNRRFKEVRKRLELDAKDIASAMDSHIQDIFEHGKNVAMAEAELKGCCKDGKKKDCKCIRK